MSLSRAAVLDAITERLEQQFGVRAQRNKTFQNLTVDLYLPPPLHCIVQYDDARHCTRQRAQTLRDYPPDIPLNFDVRRYRADQTPGDPALARHDVEIDRLALRYDLNPIVRLREDELTELPGTLTDRVATLLARRFACHAGTTFAAMLQQAGANPHRTLDASAVEPAWNLALRPPIPSRSTTPTAPDAAVPATDSPGPAPPQTRP